MNPICVHFDGFRGYNGLMLENAVFSAHFRFGLGSLLVIGPGVAGRVYGWNVGIEGVVGVQKA